jgi:hypothetical protein
MTFPSIQPTSRTWTMGEIGQGNFTAASGVEVRVLYGSNVLNQRLELSFANITEAQATEFDTHYASVRGTFDYFSLPTATYAGMTAAGFRTNFNRWRYAGPPQIESVQTGVHTVSVSLIAVTS